MITSVQRTSRYWPPSDFDQPDQHAAQHGARNVADAAEHRRGEGSKAGGIADDEARIIVVEPEDKPGGAGQRRAEEEGDEHDPVDIDAHHARRFLVLGGRLHRLAHLGAAHEIVEREHEQDRDGPEQHLAQAQHRLADLPAQGRHGIRVVLGLGAHAEQDDVEQNIGDADGGDHRGRARDAAQRPQPVTLDQGAERARAQHRTDEHEQQNADEGQAVEDLGLPHKAQGLHHPQGDERAHHEDVEVGEVDQLDDAVDHGEPEREQRIHRAQAHPVDDLLKQDIPRAHARTPVSMSFDSIHDCGAVPI